MSLFIRFITKFLRVFFDKKMIKRGRSIFNRLIQNNVKLFTKLKVMNAKNNSKSIAFFSRNMYDFNN